MESFHYNGLLMREEILYPRQNDRNAAYDRNAAIEDLHKNQSMAPCVSMTTNGARIARSAKWQNWLRSGCLAAIEAKDVLIGKFKTAFRDVAI